MGRIYTEIRNTRDLKVGDYVQLEEFKSNLYLVLEIDKKRKYFLIEEDGYTNWRRFEDIEIILREEK